MIHLVHPAAATGKRTVRRSAIDSGPGPRPAPGRGWRSKACGVAVLAGICGTCVAQGSPPGRADASAPPATSAAPLPATPVLTLTEAFRSALGHDAMYRAAGHEVEAARLGVPLARASLLPSVNLTASNNNVQGTRRFPNNLNQEVRVRLDYEAPQAALQMRMPVLNWDALSSYKMSKVQSEAAELIYVAQSLDLLDRVAEAYVRTLMAEETRTAAEGQIRSIELQLGQVQQRLLRGEGTRVQVAQMQASLDLAKARKVEADAQVELATRQLLRVTGVRDASLQRLSASPVAEQAPVEGLGDWLERGVRQSAVLQARARSVEVAKLAISRQYAGHLPRLDIVASVSRSENDSIASLGQTTSQRSVGLQLTVPLYSGGGVDASIRVAVARHARADEELRDERESLELDIQRFYQGTVSGARTVAAYRAAVASAELAWQGSRRALELGLGTTSDVAQTQAAYFSAQRDLAQARSDQLLAHIRLMARAGMPPGEITAEVDRLLALQPASATRP